MLAARAAGFSREFSSYGGFGPTNLSSGYEKGDVAAALEQKCGLPYEEIVAPGLEGRPRSRAGEAVAPVHVQHVRRAARGGGRRSGRSRRCNSSSARRPSLRTCGAYSVSVQPTDDPMKLAEQEIFHTLDASVLNEHDQAVLDEAKKLGKQIYIYNQGKDRYSFGLYQWSERAKGVRGRYEWISFIRDGYAYFDLDGREPDYSVILFSSTGLRPALNFERVDRRHGRLSLSPGGG